MKTVIEELGEALETLKKAEKLDGREPGGPMTIAEALKVVRRVQDYPELLYAAGFPYGEPPGL